MRIQTLPNSPHAINVGVVEIKSRFTGTGQGVGHNAANGEVSSGMDASGSLHDGIETSEVGAAGNLPHDVRRFRLVAPVRGDVPHEAARVVGEASVAVEGGEGGGAQIHGIVCEGAGFDAAATGAGGDGAGAAEGGEVQVAVGD